MTTAQKVKRLYALRDKHSLTAAEVDEMRQLENEVLDAIE